MPRRRFAFTLLEVVATVAIGLLVFYVAATRFSGFLDSSATNAGAQMVRDCLAEARQDALTENLPVEVRLYAASPAGYNGLQLHARNADGTTPALAPAVFLPNGAIIDATTLHSTLVTTNAATPAPDPTDAHLNRLTRCFHFLPDGTTDLATSGTWTLTVRAAAQSDPAHFPANWACVTLNPLTGRAAIYRP